VSFEKGSLDPPLFRFRPEQGNSHASIRPQALTVFCRRSLKRYAGYYPTITYPRPPVLTAFMFFAHQIPIFPDLGRLSDNLCTDLLSRLFSFFFSIFGLVGLRLLDFFTFTSSRFFSEGPFCPDSGFTLQVTCVA